MLQTVELPLWLLLFIIAFAVVAALDNVLVPSVRWFLRRRLEIAVGRLNKRLARPIEPFKLARRADTVLRLRYDPEVMGAVAEHAADEGLREDVAAQKAARYAREIVPGFSAFTYFGFAIRAARLLSQSLFRVRLARANEAALEAIPRDATVIFVMNHRSNMDYVLVTWLVAERSALAYAVGEWARVWPLRQLIRAMGGYFIRRRHSGPLYRKVLARYVQIATDAGVTQAVFPEGGLSRDGAFGSPKLGLISYILDGFQAGVSRDVVFVPVALNYDRVMEDKMLIAAQTNGTRAFRFSLRPVLRYLWRQTILRVTGRYHRYGYAAVSFGDPMSLAAFLGTARADPAAELGAELMRRIAAVMPVTPVPLVAAALEAGITQRAALKRAVADAIEEGRARGLTILIPRDDVAYTVEAGLRALTERHLLLEAPDGTLTLTGDGPAIIRYYANSVTHLLDFSPQSAPGIEDFSHLET